MISRCLKLMVRCGALAALGALPGALAGMAICVADAAISPEYFLNSWYFYSPNGLSHLDRSCLAMPHALSFGLKWGIYLGLVFAGLEAVHRLAGNGSWNSRDILLDTWRAIKISLLFWCSGGIAGLMLLWGWLEFFAPPAAALLPSGPGSISGDAWIVGSTYGLVFGCVAAGLLTIHRTYRATD